MTTNNPSQPKKAPLLFTAQEASRQDSSRLSMAWAIIVPVLFVVAIYSATFFLPFLFPPFLNAGIYGKIALFAIWIIIFATPFLWRFIGFKFLFGVIEKYTRSFYSLPDDVDAGDLLDKRLFGLRSDSPFAATTSGIVINDDKLGDKFSWASSFGGPATLIIMDGYAVYLERGGNFSRVVGSGIGFLIRYETVREIIDLRPQIKELAVDCWTKDGIKLKVHVLLECQILSAENSSLPQIEVAPESEKRFYPFYAKAVQAAVETASVAIWLGKDGKPEKYDWVAGVSGNIEGHIRTHTFSNTTNDLLRAEVTEQTEVRQPLREESNGKAATQLHSREFRELIHEKVNKDVERLGARLINLQIVKVEKNPLIDNQWKENWSAEWKSLNTITKGEANAYNIRTKEKAHATAQKDMVLAIIGGLEKMDAKHMREPLLLSLSGMLENSLVDPFVRAALPREMLETLEKIKTILDEPSP